MIVPPSWLGWRTHLLSPLLDAALKRESAARGLRHHARTFPGALHESEQAAARAAELGFALDPDWQARHMRTAALDRRDNFARLLRVRLADPAGLETRGQWPEGRFAALGLHWGAGFPVLAHLLDSGRQPAFVYRPENSNEFDSVPQRVFNRLHLRALHGFGHCIAVGGAYRRIGAAVAADRVPVILFDAPASGSARVMEFQPSPYRVFLRQGLLQLLAEQRLPFVFFRCGQHPDPARRLLEISPLIEAQSVGEIGSRAAEFLLETLTRDSAQWHLWPVAEALLARSRQPARTSSPPPPIARGVQT